jgi:hypothetical protein
LGLVGSVKLHGRNLPHKEGERKKADVVGVLEFHRSFIAVECLGFVKAPATEH